MAQALENYKTLRRKHVDPVDLIEDWFDTNVQLSDSIRKLVEIMLAYSGSSSSFPSVDGAIRQFYDEECNILADGIRRGIVEGRFRDVDADRLALFVSTHLDGVMVSAVIRDAFDLDGAMDDLRAFLWSHLGVEMQGGRDSRPARPPRPAAGDTRTAGRRKDRIRRAAGAQR